MSGVGELSAVVESIVNNKLKTEALELPAMPGVAAKIIACLEDDDNSLADVAELVKLDPFISVEVLRRANTAASGRSVDSLGSAVSRLGQLKLMRIVVEQSVRTLFKSKDATLARDFRKIWHHSLAVAAVAQSTAAEKDTAYIGGLLQEIGRVLIGKFLLDAESQLESVPKDWRENWLKVVNGVHCSVRKTALESWKLPEAFRDAASVEADYDPEGPKSVRNYVLYARAVADDAGYAPSPPAKDQTNALLMVGKQLLSIDDSVVKNVLAELDKQISTLGTN